MNQAFLTDWLRRLLSKSDIEGQMVTRFFPDTYTGPYTLLESLETVGMIQLERKTVDSRLFVIAYLTTSGIELIEFLDNMDIFRSKL